MAILSLCFLAPTADAQYYNSYYNSTTTYPYEQYYQTHGGNTNTFYGQYQNNPNVSNYTQTCPGGFTVTAHNFLLTCNKQASAYGSNYGFGSVLGASTTNMPGCMSGYTYSIVTGQRCGGNGNVYFNNNNGRLTGNNASIRDFEVKDGDDTDIEEGDDDAELIAVRFDVEDGDIRLDRVEFNFEFTGNNNGENKPWEIFDEIRLMSDGDEIDSINADDEDDWDEEDNDTYSITFTGLNEVIRENDSAELTLEVDVNSNIKGSNNNSNSWRIYVPNKGIRARDGNGDTVYAGKKSEDVSIDIDQSN